ncbi:MAG: TIGR00730 family Rossman fold protein [Ferruginibacter sp.]
MIVCIEFIRGFRALHFAGPCVTVFGSARFKSDHPNYKKTEAIAARIAEMGFTIMTGGGPGIMEAANKGARDAGGRSVGCNIRLPKEQQPNAFLDKWISIKYFFVRKTLLIKYSYAFVIMPGGFGTMDEYFEALTLIQTHMIGDFPVVVFDTIFHAKLIGHIEQMKISGAIDMGDQKLFLATDNIDEAIAHIQKNSIEKFKLVPETQPAPFKWLFEKKLSPSI